MFSMLYDRGQRYGRTYPIMLKRMVQESGEIVVKWKNVHA